MFPRKYLIASALCLLLVAGTGIIAQDEGKPATKRRAPLPTYFGKLAVSDAQREKLYAVQDTYEGRLAELQQQMNALLQEREQKMTAILTPGQKLRLAELKAEAAQKAKANPQPEADSE